MSAIAIVAMDCIFPGAGDLAAYWENLRLVKESIADLPDPRWQRFARPPHRDPTATPPFSRRGGFIDAFARFDAQELGLRADSVEFVEPEQLLALKVAARALRGLHLPALEKCGVILGRSSFSGDGENLLTSASVSARVARHFDFRGPVYNLDAGGASALVAVQHACHELSSGRCDLIVAGGVQLSQNPQLWHALAKLGLLSPGPYMRPFAADANGLLVAEGVGILVLKRLDHALSDGDRVYAIVRGCGVACDGRAETGVMPSAESQMLAMTRAWQNAKVKSSALGQLEADGSALPLVDATELQALQKFFGDEGPAVTLGSVKALIGHAMPAAGAAALIKMALALHHRMQLGSPNEQKLSPTGGKLRFRVAAQSSAWESADGPRVAAVNACSFGGMSAHVVLEEHAAEPRPEVLVATVASGSPPGMEPALLIAAPTKESLLEKLSAGRSSYAEGGSHRLAVLNPTAERLMKARELVQRGQNTRGIQGMWCASNGLITEGGKVVFMYPGIDSGARPHVQDVAGFFKIDDQPPTVTPDLERRGMDVFFTSELYTKVLRQLRITPDMICGHSLGEWSAAVASELTPEKSVNDFISMLQSGALRVPGVVFAALGCDVKRAQESLRGLSGVQVSHDNCPHQSIICGLEPSVDEAMNRLREGRVLCQKLDFQSGFHTELFKDYVGPLEEIVRRTKFTPPRIPVWSATSCRPYPQELEAVRGLTVQHLLEPVRFRELTRALYDAGGRIFVQVGSGSLCGFVSDTLRGLPHQALNTVINNRPGLHQLERCCLALFVEGADFDLSFLQSEAKAAPSGDHSRLLNLAGPSARSAASEPLSTPILQELEESFSEMGAAMAAVVGALRPSTAFKRSLSRRLSLAERPELMDHCFYKQKAGWQNTADLFPVMPMTGSFELVRQIATEQLPHLKAVAIHSIMAKKWISVENPKELDIEVEYDGRHSVRVDLRGYFSATVEMRAEYPAPPSAELPALAGPRPARVRAEDLYRDGWLFHGPAFQCIDRIEAIGENGIDARLRVNTVPGALLDNAGQLAGYWLMESVDVDRYSMPIRVGRVEFYGPAPTSGEVGCQFRVSQLNSRTLSGNFEISHENRIWVRIAGWDKWRFVTENPVWEFMLKPGRRQISVERQGCSWFERPDPSPAYCDDLAKRYLREAERKIYEQRGSKKCEWILGRVAAKDAVRRHLWQNGYAETIFPAEIWIENETNGRPRLSEVPGGRPLYVSISHKHGIAVACAGASPNLGIDIEKIEERDASFVALFLNPDEEKLLPADLRAEWIVRFWGAKEAFAKAQGTGLRGAPRQFRIRAVEAGRINIEGRWITSHKIGSYILSQTEACTSGA